VTWRAPALLALGLTLTGEASAGVQKFALVAGANTGFMTDEGLRFAEQDADRIAEVLESLGGVDPGNVVLLKGATAPRFRSVFDNLRRRIEGANALGDETMVYVYYSGHADADALRMGDTLLPLDELMDSLETLDVKVRVLVVDACQSGELTRKGATPTTPFVIKPQTRLESEGTAIITSSSVGEDAQESDRLGGGVFTHHFVAGLAGAADASGDGRVTITEAYDYARGQTIRTTSRARVVQHPAVYDLRGQEDLVLTTVVDADTGGLLALADPGEYLVFDTRRSRDLVMEVAVEEDTRVSLAPGDYLVRLRGANEVREATVKVERGDTTRLSDGEMTALSYGQTVRKGLATEKRLAVALTMGGGVLGPSVPEGSALPLGAIGFRFDLPALTFGTRIHYANARWQSQFLTQQMQRGGVDLYFGHYWDFGKVAPGLLFRGGADIVRQTFDSPGDAPGITGVQGRLGPVLAFDVAVAPRWTIGFTGGADLLLYSVLETSSREGGFTLRALPHAAVELTAYVF
jgi:hypothetical protein